MVDVELSGMWIVEASYRLDYKYCKSPVIIDEANLSLSGQSQTEMQKKIHLSERAEFP